MKLRLKYLLTCLYISFVAIHLLLFVFLKKQKIDSLQKREKSNFPSLNLNQETPFYPRLETYIADHFPGKNAYIRQSNILFKGILGAANAKDQVLWGKKQWFFYNASVNDEKGINEAFGYRALTPLEVTKVKHNIETIQNWCKRHHIHFEVIICPNKHSIYQENLPSAYTIEKQKSQLDQLYNKIPFLANIKRLLMNAKNKETELYYPQDTHWNKYGAYLAVAALQERLLKYHPYLQPFEARPYFKKPNKQMDLANMMGLNGFIKNRELDLFFVKKPAKKIQHLMIVHDSFLTNMKPALQKLFVKVSPKFIFSEGLLSPQILLKEKVDVFVIELVERYKSALIGDIHPDYYK
jgi:hypothetical protein